MNTPRSSIEQHLLSLHKQKNYKIQTGMHTPPPPSPYVIEPVSVNPFFLTTLPLSLLLYRFFSLVLSAMVVVQ